MYRKRHTSEDDEKWDCLDTAEEKGEKEFSNYRPVTCLPLVWKLLTGLIVDEVYAFLDNERFLSEEQKICHLDEDLGEQEISCTLTKSCMVSWVEEKEFCNGLELIPQGL